MKPLLQNRLLFLKKQAFSLLFWLVFPLLATCAVMQLAETAQEETKIPVGLAVEESSDLARTFTERLSSYALIDVRIMPAEQALRQLEQHQLDSVFVIPAGFEAEILSGSRHHLITGYRSDRSFAYAPVKEMVLSHVQKIAGRYKAAVTVEQLSEHLGQEQTWPAKEVIATADTIEKEQHLLSSHFSYAGNQPASKEGILLNPWGIWAIFALLSAFFLFDWVVKEKRMPAFSRLNFMKIKPKAYLLGNGLIYVGITLVFDACSVIMLSNLYETAANVRLALTLFLYRLAISLIAFLAALAMHKLPAYYGAGAFLALCFGLFGGAATIGASWFDYLNPVRPVMDKEPSIWLPAVLVGVVIIWFFRKESSDASS